MSLNRIFHGGHAPSEQDTPTPSARSHLARFHSRTSRFRSSGENRIRRPIDPILRSNEISENTGTVQLSISGVWQHTLLIHNFWLYL